MDEKKKILIVDDDIEFTTNISAQIAAAGMDPHVAVSGKEALDYIRDNKVDFIILDFVMPEMDGYTFYHVLKHDMRKSIPTIILTNLAGTKDPNELEVYVKSETNMDELIGKIKTRISPQAAS